jgi:hypothetical protein
MAEWSKDFTRSGANSYDLLHLKNQNGNLVCTNGIGTGLEQLIQKFG